MVSSILRLASIACCGVLLISFVAFASDQAGEGSKQTVAKIGEANSGRTHMSETELNAPDPSASTERMREKRHGSLREKLDDANDALVSPFDGIVASDSVWAQRVATGLLGFLVFGLGLGYLARLVAARGI